MTQTQTRPSVTGTKAPMRHEPATSTLSRLHDELDRTIERFFHEPWSWTPDWPAAEGARWRPSLDVSETENELVITVETPGISPEDIDVSVTDHTITISGEKREQTEQRDENRWVSERRYGAFRRSLELPDTIDVDNVEAKHDNGVLAVHLKKLRPEKRKRISILPSKRR